MRPRSQAQLLWMGSDFDAVPEHVPNWNRHLLLAREMHDTQAHRLTPHTHPAHSPARPADPQIPLTPLSRPGRALAKPAQSRCHSFGRLRRLLAVRRARAANSKTSICALDHVAALPRLLSNDEAEALADCTACGSSLVSVLPVSSEWWRCVCGVLGTGSSRSPRRSGIRLALKSAPECHRVRASRLRSGGRCRCLLGTIDCARVVPANIAHKVITFRCSTTTPDFELLELLRARPDAQCVHLRLHGVELGLQSRVLVIAVVRRHLASDCPRHGARTSDRATCSARSRALPPLGALPTLRFLAVFLAG